jgi:hypothetical protein
MIAPDDDFEKQRIKPKKKKGVNGKAKGNAYERKICKDLSHLLTQGKEDYAVWRSASSGAVATVLRKKPTNIKESFLKAHTGDIVQAIPQGQYPELDNFFNRFFVETKFYKDLSLYPPFSKELRGFISQLSHEKEASGKFIFFVFKANNREELIFTDCLFDHKPNFTSKIQMEIFIGGLELSVYLFKDFQKHYLEL